MEETHAAADDQDRDLVKRYLAGHRDAASGLVDRYQKRLYNIALRMTGNAQDAEDATQTVFLNAFLKLSTYDPRFRFFSWIYRMTVNESLNMLKRQNRNVTLEDIPVVGSGTDHETEVQDQVGKALMQLKPDDRAVVVLKHFMFFSYEEIGEVLEIPVKTVKSRLFTARERLRLTLGERTDQP